MEKHQRIRWIGKFFKSSDINRAGIKGKTEFENLLFLRSIGFSTSPHYVVKPYGFNPFIDNILVLEYLSGEPLSQIINNAVFYSHRKRLFKTLSALAYFLATLHNRTAGDYTVYFDDHYHYMGQLLTSLTKKQRIGRKHSEDFWSLRDHWRSRSCMWEDRNVIVHGDATPANFLFSDEGDVMAIDLERMKWSDRVFDLGRLCGELKHFFFKATHNPLASEPFIKHFLWKYSHYFPDKEITFRSITRRLPFYMGITLLRIARNSWIDDNYSRQLIHEAKQILKADI
jgi:thiamine kinase-like enzyme